MAGSASPKLIRSISGQSGAESAPTTSSAWVNTQDVAGGFFGKAKVHFTAPTLGDADNDVTITIWGREGDTILVLGERQINTSTDRFDDLDLGAVSRATSYYATVDAISGTTAEVTVDVYVRPYNDDDAAAA